MSMWDLDEVKYLSRSADHLGSLANVLKDLGGDETILHELTQNADDADGATTIRFLIASEALTVWNDGVFSNCGQQASKRCPWRQDHGRSCDLHSFRVFSGRHKSGDASTTGAFGVGFTCVYHLTDHPELVTAGSHFLLDEAASEDQRIRVCHDRDCPRDHEAVGTTFILPWAREESPLREQLEVETIDDERIARLETAFRKDAAGTLLFLKRVSTIEVSSRSGTLTVERTVEGDLVRISSGEQEEEWLLLEGEHDTSAELKRRYRDIDPNRGALVQVAIRVGQLVPGRFYAGLPSKMPTGWGGHINGSFYPRTDRKSFEFGDGTYRSEWNLDLLDSAAHLVAQNLEKIAETVGVVPTWEILRDVEHVARDVNAGNLPQGFEQVFTRVAGAVSDAAILQVLDGGIRAPSGAVLAMDSAHYPGARIVHDLGLSVVHPDLRSIVFETEYTKYGINRLTAARLIEHLTDEGLLVETWKPDEGLLEDDEVDLLLELLESLLDRSKSWIGEPETSQIAVVPCIGRRYAPVADAVRLDDEALRQLFTEVDPDLLVVDSERTARKSPTILGLVRELDLETGVNSLSNVTNPGLLHEYANQVIAWLGQHRSTLESSDSAKAKTRELPIFPSSGGGRDSLTRLSVSSDFEDLFGIADLIDADFAQHHWSLLESIGVGELGAVEYLTKHIIPRLDEFASDPQALELVLDLAYDARRELDQAPWAVEMLRTAPLVMCTDGVARRASEVHMPNAVVSLINPDTPIADVDAISSYLHDTVIWLGASTRPSQSLVNEAAWRLAEAPEDPDPTVCGAILEAIEDASTELASVPIGLANLRDLPWLPIEGGGKGRPADVYPIFQSYLFESQGPKLGLDRSTQFRNADMLYWLGMPKEPTPAMVVAHLRHCAAAGEPMNNEVYVWLGRELNPADLNALANEAIIQTSPGVFLDPRQAFWQPTQLGRWASQLPHEMRRYQDFLDGIGVAEEPTASDLDFILKLIADEVGTNRLDPEDELVVHECWTVLDSLLRENPATERTLQLIGRRPSFPDRRGVLARPERLIFRDPRKLVDQIELLANEVIDRERRTQHALESAGVTKAEDVIEVDPVDVVSTEDTELMAVLDERRVPLQRAIDSVAAAHPELDVDPDNIRALDVHRASSLNVVYRASIGSQQFATPPQSIDAMFFADEFRVVHTHSTNKIPVAREMSRAIAPYVDPSELAPLIVTVLDASSSEDAMLRLDDYGVASVVDIDRETVASSVAVDVVAEAAEVDSVSDEGIADELEPGDPEGPSDEDGPAIHGAELDEFAGGATDEDSDDEWPPEPTAGIDSDIEDGDGSQGAGSGITGPSADRAGGIKSGDGGKRNWRGTGSATRMRSYVLFGDDSDHGTTGDEAPDAGEIDRAGVERVLAYERASGREPEEKDHTNPGFDVLSRGKAGDVVRRIEIKSIRGEWTFRGVMLTSRQFREATVHGDEYWLYVVENAEDDDLYRIHRIQDPANRIDFFGFDNGWQALREPDIELDAQAAPPVRSTRGLLRRSPGQSAATAD